MAKTKRKDPVQVYQIEDLRRRIEERTEYEKRIAEYDKGDTLRKLKEVLEGSNRELAWCAHFTVAVWHKYRFGWPESMKKKVALTPPVKRATRGKA